MGAPDRRRAWRSRGCSVFLRPRLLLRQLRAAPRCPAAAASARPCCPRVYARPLELRRGQSLTEQQLVDRLNDLGYAQRTMFDRPGEFVIGSGDVTIMPARRPNSRASRAGGLSTADAAQRESSPRRRRSHAAARCRSGRCALERGTRATERVTLDAPAPDRAHQRRAREAAAGGARRDSRPHDRRRAGDRGPPLLPASRRRPDPHGRRDLLVSRPDDEPCSRAPAPSPSR